jgi:phage terminase small subunit
VNDLNPRQRQFALEYLIDLNATQAAIRSGYGAATAKCKGHQNLSKPHIAALIAKLQAERSARTQIAADRVLFELARIGFSDIRNVMQWGEAVAVRDEKTGEDRLVQGIALVCSEDLTADAAAAISEVSQAKDGSLKLKLHDKRAALADIGRHLGMFVERTEITGKDGRDLIPEEPASSREVAKSILALIARASAEAVEGDK